MATFQSLTVFGLMLDIIGVVLIYKYAVARTRPGSLNYSAETPESEREAGEMEQRARLGLVLLVSGFVLQGIGTLSAS